MSNTDAGSFKQVVEGDDLYSIAHSRGLRDNGQSIWEHTENTQYVADSRSTPSVLQPGETIWIPFITGEELAETDAEHTFRVSSPEQLAIVIQLQDWAGSVYQRNVRFTYRQEGEDPPEITGVAGNGKITIPGVSFEAREGTLILERKEWDGSFSQSEEIRVEISRLNPLREGNFGRNTVQRVLRNLGYYTGDIDADFGERTRAAIWQFQVDTEDLTPNGTLDMPTLEALAGQAHLEFDTSLAEPVNRESVNTDPCMPAPTAEAETVDVPLNTNENKGFLGAGYTDPEDLDAQRVRDRISIAEALNEGAASLGSIVMPFPEEIFVSVCLDRDREEEASVNPVRVRKRSVAVMDVGCWYHEHRDFGLIWGSHAYMCKYHAAGNFPRVDLGRGGFRNEGLDVTFFQNMADCVEVVSYCNLTWAEDAEGDFEWDRIYLVIGDTHFMDETRAGIWATDKHQQQLLQPEIEMFQFSQRVLQIAEMNNTMMVVQTGDFYDLWVGQKKLWVSEDERNRLLRWDTFRRKEVFFDDYHAYYEDDDEYANPSMKDPDDYEEANGTKVPIPVGDTDRILGRASEDVCSWLDDINILKSVDGKTTILNLYRQQLDLYQKEKDQSTRLWEIALSNLQRRLPGWRALLDLGPGGRIWPGRTPIRIRNPGILGFRNFQVGLTRHGVAFIYGNHDSYMGLMEDQGDNRETIVSPGRLPHIMTNRRRTLIFEHGHRLAAFFSSLAANYDGDSSAFNMTNWVYFKNCLEIDPEHFGLDYGDLERSIKGKAAAWLLDWIDDITNTGWVNDLIGGSLDPEELMVELHNIPEYKREISQICLGRQLGLGNFRGEPPSLYVMGHTHKAYLAQLDIRVFNNNPNDKSEGGFLDEYIPDDLEEYIPDELSDILPDEYEEYVPDEVEDAVDDLVDDVIDDYNPFG